jgi:hypothetical protein
MNKAIFRNAQYMSKLSLCKLFLKDMKHADGIYKLGLNEIERPQDFKNNMSDEYGFFFREYEHALHFISLGNYGYIGKIELCDNSRIVEGCNLYKTDKFQLKSIETIEEYLDSNGLELDAVQSCGISLKYIMASRQTIDIVTAAVRNNGLSLQFASMSLRTPDVCAIAVINKSAALEFVPENLQTFEMCNAAVKKTPL